MSRLKERQALEELLRDLRKKSGLRQIDVALALGIPQSMVSKYESGERRLDILEVREICHLLGISLSNFVEHLEAKIGKNDAAD